MKDNLNANWGKALEIMFKVLNKFIFEGWVNKIWYCIIKKVSNK